MRPPFCSTRPGLAELAGEASQSLQGPGVFFAQQLAGTVDVHLRQRSRAGCAGQQLFQLLEVRQLADDRVGGSEAEGQAQEVVVARGAFEVTEELLELHAQGDVVLEERLGELGQLRPLLRGQGTEQGPGRRHLAGQRRQQLVKIFRAPGDEVPVTLHELLEVGLDVGARLPALDHAVELGQHLPGALEHLRRSVGDGRLELGEGVAGQFCPLAADPVEQLSQPGHVPAGPVPETLLHQPAQRLVGVPVLEEVVHQTAQDVVAVQVAVFLAAVPAGVP